MQIKGIEFPDGDISELLLSAAASGDVDAIEALLSAGARTDYVDVKGLSAIDHANDGSVVQLLVDHGVDIDGVFGGSTALIWAVQEGAVTRAAALLEAGASTDIRDSNDLSALDYAKSAEIVALLLRHGADIHSLEREGRTALMFASKMGLSEKVEMLLQAGARADLRDAEDISALDCAKGTEVISLLLQNGVEVNGRDQKGRTALMFHSDFGDEEEVALLLEAGADIRIRDTTGKTALHHASTGQITEQLLRQGAAINDLAGRSDQSPLMRASFLEQLDKVEVLLAHGASVNLRNAMGDSALYEAQGAAITQMLLDNGADIDAAVHTGMTPLMDAAEEGDLDKVRVLLNAGAQTNLRDGSGGTALHGSKGAEMTRLLLDYGADANILSKNGDSAWRYGLLQNDKDKCSVLAAAGASRAAGRHGVGRTTSATGCMSSLLISVVSLASLFLPAIVG